MRVIFCMLVLAALAIVGEHDGMAPSVRPWEMTWALPWMSS